MNQTGFAGAFIQWENVNFESHCLQAEAMQESGVRPGTTI
jgi:hypothetical protein